MNSSDNGSKWSQDRRTLLLGLTGAFVTSLVPLRAWSTPQAMLDAIQGVFGDMPLREGKVKLQIPPIAENGNSVPLVVEVDSAMNDQDYVRSVHIFSEKNPLPEVARYHFSAGSGKARVATRIRLADSQSLIAIATLSDGSLWSASAKTEITLAACIDLS